MASELLFDLDAIDMKAVAIDPHGVAEINPQCGLMRQLDYVIWLNDANTQALGVKNVGDDEFWAPYHIPGRPIMPGVLIIEAAAQLSSVLYRQKVDQPKFIGFTRCDNTIFRRQVLPGDTLHLLAEEIEFRKRRFICNTQGLVDDQLAFESRITGMVI